MLSFLRSLYARRLTNSVRRPAPARKPLRPAFEVLEDRTLLTGPVAHNDFFRVVHDRLLTGNVLSNDTPAGTLTAILTTNPAHGSLTLASDGNFTFSPERGYVGQDRFAYRASNGTTQSNIGFVFLDVANNAPVAAGDLYEVSHDRLFTAPAGSLFVNDSDSDNDTFTSRLSSGPSHGVLSLNTDGSFAYTPNGLYLGSDSFSYSVSDGVALSNAVTVSLNVGNTAPVAVAEAFLTTHDRLFEGAGLLSNDSDADGDALTASLVSGPGHGALTLIADGSFRYTPVLHYVGPDSFTYQVSDGLAASAPVTVALTVGNGMPTAMSDAFIGWADQVLKASTLFGNDQDGDGDGLTVVVLTNPTHGTLSVHADGTFDYTPDLHYTGPDSFTYQVSDGILLSGPATVTLQTNYVMPVANNDWYILTHDLPLSVDAPGLLANDIYNSDAPLGGGFSVEVVSGPSHGTLDISTEGSFTYTPAASYVGSDQFTYRIDDGIGSSNVPTVFLLVVNGVPAPLADGYRVPQDQVFTENTGVLVNDADSDGDSFTAILVTNPAHGTLSLQVNGTFTYTPEPDFIGVDSFTYRIYDGFNKAAL